VVTNLAAIGVDEERRSGGLTILFECFLYLLHGNGPVCRVHSIARILPKVRPLHFMPPLAPGSVTFGSPCWCADLVAKRAIPHSVLRHHSPGDTSIRHTCLTQILPAEPLLTANGTV